MSRRDINSQKREQMAALMRRLINGGWSREQVAQRLKVTASTVGSWARGESMGTNAQREVLGKLPEAPEEG